VSFNWEHPQHKAGAARGGATALAQRPSWSAPAPRKMAAAPSAWVGLVLMVANTAIALVDLFLLAGGIPH